MGTDVKRTVWLNQIQWKSAVTQAHEKKERSIQVGPGLPKTIPWDYHIY